MKKAFLITAGVLLASLTVNHHYQQHQAKQALRRQYRAEVARCVSAGWFQDQILTRTAPYEDSLDGFIQFRVEVSAVGQCRRWAAKQWLQSV